MWRRRRESKVMALIDEHMKKVEECLQGMVSVLELHFQDRMGSAEPCSSGIRRVESEADDIRRDIADLLHRGAFLPIFRQDVMELVVMVDRIADCAQDCSKFIVVQRAEVPDTLRESFLRIARDSAAVLSPLEQGVTGLSGDVSTTRAKVAEVHRIESAVDELEWQLSCQIFSADLPLAHKIHLQQLVDVIGSITDIAEDAAEVLETLVIKRQV